MDGRESTCAVSESSKALLVKPKASVCMIAFNHAAFIEQSIESILSQDADFEFELVIGDDCSSDGTADICARFASLDARVRLLPIEKNLGVMPNFVRTLLECRGEYIAICEGDDFWTDRGKLRKQVQFLDRHPDYAGAAHQSIVLATDKPVSNFKENVPSSIGTDGLLAGRLFHTASVLFRRPVLGLFCGSPPVLSCDRLLNLCISFLGLIHYSDEPMCAYRLHGAGMSSNASVEQMKLDLNSIPYLRRINPSFPTYRYLSYVYATIGLCRAASPLQKARYLGLAFIYSFSYFPANLSFIVSRLLKAAKLRPL